MNSLNKCLYSVFFFLVNISHYKTKTNNELILITSAVDVAQAWAAAVEHRISVNIEQNVLLDKKGFRWNYSNISVVVLNEDKRYDLEDEKCCLYRNMVSVNIQVALAS